MNVSFRKIELEGSCPIYTWLPLEEIEESTLRQIQDISRLPCALHVAVMPDAHTGYGMPIGAALGTKNCVVPYAVGSDIACGMIAVKTSLEYNDRTGEGIRRALEEIYKLVPVGNPHKGNRNQGNFLDRQDSQVLREWHGAAGDTWAKSAESIREAADRQLGTLGGGNHFIELQHDGTNIWLMLHTGSRNFGKIICDMWYRVAIGLCDQFHTPIPDRQLACLPIDTWQGQQYLLDMHYAMRYADESRRRIYENCILAMRAVFGKFEEKLRIETVHNFAAVEKHLGRQMIVHRKGAVCTAKNVLVILPGSMQTSSCIAEGIENRLALNTCSHGAGRAYGRNAARKAFEGRDIRKWMQDEDIELICPPDSDVLDECGPAYKSLESVMWMQQDLCQPIVLLKPLGVVKG
jgi:tRNA-splicing ligase RtcB